MRVISVCTGRAVERPIDGRAMLTAIGKAPQAGPVAVHRMGLAGDEQADPTVHGGLARAVYAYPAEHLPFWQTVRAQARVAGWHEPVAPGLMGENLLLEGLTEAGMWIGDRLLLPGCVLAVNAPRMPCSKFAAAMGFAQALKLMLQSGYCGAYLAVIEPGQVSAGDRFTLQRGPREVNIADLFRAQARG